MLKFARNPFWLAAFLVVGHLSTFSQTAVTAYTISPSSCVGFSNQQVTHQITTTGNPSFSQNTMYGFLWYEGPAVTQASCGNPLAFPVWLSPAPTATLNLWCPNQAIGTYTKTAQAETCPQDAGASATINIVPMPWSMTLPGGAFAGSTIQGTITLGFPAPPQGIKDDSGVTAIGPCVNFTVSNPSVTFSGGNVVSNSVCYTPGSTLMPFSLSIAPGTPDQDVTLTGSIPDNRGNRGPSQTYVLHVSSDGSENLGCNCDDEAVAGRPINLTTGNVWIAEQDYSIPGLGGGMRISRMWNSLYPTAINTSVIGMFGHSWHSNLEEQLQLLGGIAKYTRSDGSGFIFQQSSNGTYTLSSPPDAHTSLTFTSTTNQYTITFADGTGRNFDQSGLLLSTFDRNGNGISVSRDTSHRITAVTDTAGRQLTLTYGNAANVALVTSIQDVIGTVATYAYGPSNELLSVQYPDGSVVNHVYDSNLLITSTTDANSKILESHTYDSSRRGLTSARAGGAQQVTVAYGTAAAHVTDSNSNVTDYAYQTIGRKNFITSTNGPGCATCGGSGVNTFSYDSGGNRTSATDALNRVANFTYDSNGNVLSASQVVSGNTITESYTYNSFGEVLTATDPLGHVTTNTYDPKGNLLTTTTPSPGGKTAGSKTTFAYDTKGELTQVTDPLGHITKFTYTPAGLVSTITDPLGHLTSYGYDGRGNRTSITDALNNQTTFQYDGRNRLTKITKPDQSTISYVYDLRGRRTSVTDENNNITQYAYDDADRVISVTDANNGLTQYAYDSENNLTSITDPALRITSFAYDAQRRLTQTTFPSTKSEIYGYDAVNNLISKTDRKGQVITYSYDELNRLMGKQYPDGTAVSYTYDAASRLTQVHDASGTYTFGYDNMDRMTSASAVYSFLPSRTFGTSYTYDAASNRNGMTDPNGGSISYGYDAMNRLTSLKDFNRNTFTFGYDVLNRTSSLNRPNAVNTTYQYDSVSRLLSVLHQKGTATVDGATYSYDSVGNTTSRTNKANNISSRFSYDRLYELTAMMQGGSSVESYSYDMVGNRLSSASNSTYTYDASNALQSVGAASFTYDSNGNTLTKTDASGTTAYTWDVENRLTAALPPSGTSVTFSYDPFGRRIKKGNSIYVYDGVNVIQESDSAGNLVARYVQGAGVDHPLVAYRGSTTEFYESDGLGSVTSLTTTGGSVNQTYVFDPFGGMIAGTGGFTQPFRYTGREFDTETGLYYYRARYYDPTNGRFLSEDPLEFAAGNNFYEYAYNSPVNFTDPTGFQPEPIYVAAPPQFTVIIGGAGKGIAWGPIAAVVAAYIGVGATGYYSYQATKAQMSANAAYAGESQAIHRLNQALLARPKAQGNCSSAAHRLHRPGKTKEECDQEWEEAREECSKILAIPRSSPEWKKYTELWGGNYDRCVRGHVTEDCGGSRIEW